MGKINFIDMMIIFFSFGPFLLVKYSLSTTSNILGRNKKITPEIAKTNERSAKESTLK